MTLSTTNVNALKNLIRNDPALCEDLRESSGRQELTSKLAAAALAKGIVIDQAELGKGLDLALDQYADNPEVSDEQLENVTGGLVLSTGAVLGMIAIVGLIAGGVGAAAVFGHKLVDKF